MEDTMIEFLENGLHEEIILYNELLNCFNKEREALMLMDMDNLWNISREKNELGSKISFIEKKIFSAVRAELNKRHSDKYGITADFSKWSELYSLITDIVKENDRSNFNRLYSSLHKLKSEIDAMRKVNSDTINHSLQFLDEIISIITGQTQQNVIYNDRCTYNFSRNNMLMNREV